MLRNNGGMRSNGGMHYQVMEEARRTLEDIVRQRYHDAARTQDHDSLLRHLRLYKPLQMQAEGLAAFQDYVRKLLSERASRGYDTLMDSFASNQQPDFVTALSTLLQTVVAAVEENETLLRETFGDEGLSACVLAWHEQCDSDASKVLVRYTTHRQLAQLAKEVGGAHRPTGGAVSGPDPRTVRCGPSLLLFDLCCRWQRVLFASPVAVGQPINCHLPAHQLSF